MYLSRTVLLHRLSPLAKPSSSARLAREAITSPSIRQMTSSGFPGGPSGEKVMYILVIGAASAGAGYYTYRTIYSDKVRYNSTLEKITSEAKKKLTIENSSEDTEAATGLDTEKDNINVTKHMEDPIDPAADAQSNESPSDKEAAMDKKEGETINNVKDPTVPAAVSDNEAAPCTDPEENCQSAQAPLDEEVPSIEDKPGSHDVAAQNNVQISEVSESFSVINDRFILLTSAPPIPEEPPTCISEETSEKADNPSAEEMTSAVVADLNIAASLVSFSSPPEEAPEGTTRTPEDSSAIETPSAVEDGPGNQDAPVDLAQDINDAALENALEEMAPEDEQSEEE